MKRLLLSLVCLASTFAAFSQANVTSTAISVQGIARNSSNNAVANSSISISAELYYINSSNTAVNILTRTGTVNTDAFGVFAYVVDISSSDFIKITNSEAWIKISSGGVTFAQEKLMAVPYALHAQNGAPTGSIMPYVGSTAPAGWLLCDGSAIPAGDAYASLKTILGNATNVPDLRGMFIRGAGTNSVNTYANNVGPSLRAIQADGVVNHAHAFTSNQATTNTTGEHGHEIYGNSGGTTSSTVSRVALRTSVENPAGGNDDAPYGTTASGSHSHTVTVSGTTNNQSSGLSETRPINFGVNYIIKI
jgi:microcystin-dependent protein